MCSLFQSILYLCTILITNKKIAIMKGQIHLDGEVIYSNNNISAQRLEDIADKLFHDAGCSKMADRVKRQARVFMSH